MEPWLQILVQIPIVGVFIWYTLERDKRERDDRLKRDQEWREFLKLQSEATAAALRDVSGKLSEVTAKLDTIIPRGEDK